MQIYRAFGAMAEWTGLEPATPDVTGRYSNQLNYHSVRINLFFKLSSEEKRILQTLLKIASPQRVLVFCQKRCVLHNDCAFYRKLNICQEHEQIFFRPANFSLKYQCPETCVPSKGLCCLRISKRRFCVGVPSILSFGAKFRSNSAAALSSML